MYVSNCKSYTIKTEKGCEKKNITSVVFLDLAVAYNTVNQQIS